jgi:hypothetical protein
MKHIKNEINFILYSHQTINLFDVHFFSCANNWLLSIIEICLQLVLTKKRKIDFIYPKEIDKGMNYNIRVTQFQCYIM